MAEMEAKGDKFDKRLENGDEVKKAKQQEEKKEMQTVQGENYSEMELKTDEMVDETVQKEEENCQRDELIQKEGENVKMDDRMKEHENGKKNAEMGHKDEDGKRNAEMGHKDENGEKNAEMGHKDGNDRMNEKEQKDDEKEQKEENAKKNDIEKKEEENEKRNEEKEQMEEKNVEKDDIKPMEENNARMDDMGQKEVIVSKAEEMQLQIAINEEEKPEKMKLTKKSEELIEEVRNHEENDDEMSVEESKNEEKVEDMDVEEENKNSENAKQMMPSTQNCEKAHRIENDIDTRMFENVTEENIEKSGKQYEGDQEMNDAEQDEKKTSQEEEDDRSSTSMGLLLSTASTSDGEEPKKYRKASTIPANKKYLHESSSSSSYSEDGSPMTSARTSGIIPKKESTRGLVEMQTSPERNLPVKSSSEESSAEDYADTSFSRKSTTELSSDDGANDIPPTKDLPIKNPVISQDSQDKDSSQANAPVGALSKRIKRRRPRNERKRSYPRKRFRTRYLPDLIKYRDRLHPIVKLRNYPDSEENPNLPTIRPIVIEEEDISSISTTGEIHELEIGAEISIESSTQKSGVESDSDSTLKQSSHNEGASRKRPAIDDFIAYKKVRVTVTNGQRSIKAENSDKAEAGEISSVEAFDAKDTPVDSSLEREELVDSAEGSSKIVCNNDVAARTDSKVDNTPGKRDESTANDYLNLKKSGRKRRASSDSESDVSKKSKPVESKCSVDTKYSRISPVDSTNLSRPKKSTTSQLFIMKTGDSPTKIETVDKNASLTESDDSAGRRETKHDQKPVTEESTAEMRAATDQKPEIEVSPSAMETDNETPQTENSIPGVETNDQKSSSKDMPTSVGLEQGNSQGCVKPTVTASSNAIETHLAELKMSSNSDNSDKTEKTGEETNENDEPMDL